MDRAHHRVASAPISIRYARVLSRAQQTARGWRGVEQRTAREMLRKNNAEVAALGTKRPLGTARPYVITAIVMYKQKNVASAYGEKASSERSPPPEVPILDRGET